MIVSDNAIVAGLILLAVLVCAPVLLSPHWGMLSDAGQIINFGRVFWSDPLQNVEMLRVFWRPGFHVCDLLLWSVAHENPFWFYLFRTVLFAFTIVLTYKNCCSLSNSRSLSAFISCLWAISSSTAEVLFTLDKGEPYLAVSFSFFLFCYLQLSSTLRRSAALTLLAFAACTWAMFTKETAQILVVFGATNFVLATLSDRKNRGNSRWNWLSSPPLRFLFITGIAYGLYKAFLLTHGGGDGGSYLPMQFKLDTIVANWTFYSRNLTDEVLVLALCTAGALLRVICGQLDDNASRTACSLTVTALAGAAAFLCLPVTLAYIWFPLYALLLPALSHQLSRIGDWRWLHVDRTFARLCILIPLAVFLCSTLPLRAYQAQYQFQVDALAQDLCSALADYARTHQCQKKQVVFLFYREGQTEIGERLEFFTLDRLYKHHMERSPGLPADAPFDFQNYLAYQTPSKPASTARVSGERSAEPGLKCYSYGAYEGRWYEHTVEPGALFVIPFGDISEEVATCRASGLFVSSWQSKAVVVPQIRLKEVFTVTRPILRAKGRKSTIGWKVLSAESIAKLSWDMPETGCIATPFKIYLEPSAVGKKLKLHCCGAVPQKLLVTDGMKTTMVSPNQSGDILITVKNLRDGYLSIGAHDTARNSDPTFLCFDEVRIE